MQTDEDYTGLVDQSPFITTITFTRPMQFYKSGVYRPTTEECFGDRLYKLKVNVDGYRMDSASKDGYYILKFPFGTEYGMSGNLRFVKGGENDWFSSGMCGFYKVSMAVVAANP